MSIVWNEENARQEAWNSWTHGIGFLLSIPAGVLLTSLVIDNRQSLIVACLIYSISLTAMYLFSTLSHWVRDPQWRHAMRAWDQGVIYFLIAGTFTPLVWAFVPGWPKGIFLGFMWFAAGAGFYSKVVAQHRVNNLAAISHIVLGWGPGLILFGYVPLLCFGLILAGGALYTAGVLFLQNDHRSWVFHPIWHVMVIAASTCHYLAIMLFAILQLDLKLLG